MIAVHTWLEGLGLGQYAESFERNAIDPDLLPGLTDAQLEELGVRPLGHRLRLLAAIAVLRSEGVHTALKADRRPHGEPAGDRRQLTVLFCDLVGSTALSRKLDPEDLGALIQTYQQTCRAVVERCGGHIAQYLGDGVMVYFGWPRAHEDDAQRSVRAATEILDALRGVPSPEPLHVRIGIATGLVVIGVTGAGDANEPMLAVGETPNLAARLQGLAGSDEVVVAEPTRALAGGTFAYEDLGEHFVKGIPEPVRAWRVLGESRVAGRFEATHSDAPTPLVGREPELELLRRAWDCVRQGMGEVVVLRGEAGIGKSRIALELCATVAQTPHHLLRFQCLPYNINSAFFPIISHLERAAGLTRSDTPATKLDKLEALLPRWRLTDSMTPIYAALLSLPLDRYPPSRVSAAKQKENTIDAIVSSVVALSKSNPVLMVFEDAHWVDPTTLETLSAIIDGIRSAPVLLTITCRPEFAPPWTERSHVTLCELGRLSPHLSADMVATVTRGKALPEALLRQIVAKTDGIPLFVEEVTKSVLASELLGRKAERYVRDGEAPGLEIPATLKELLAARLDALADAKKIAQIGAVIGRQFRYDVVVALFGSAGGDPAGALDQLVQAGLVSRDGVAPEVVFSFKHALVQDSAYESLLKSERQALHRKAGDLLSERFPETADSAPELLARHYTAGNVFEPAVRYWLKAGERAWQRSAAKEAIAHLTGGLELVDKITDAATRDALELRLQAALGVVYFATVSYAAPQAQAAFLRAYELTQRVRQPELLAPVLYGIGAFQTMKGDVRAGHGAFEKLMAVATASAQPRLLLYAHAVLTWSNYSRADYPKAVEHANHVLALYESAPQAGARLSAADPKVISECFRALALWSQGFPDQADAVSDALLAHARALGDPYSLAYALNFAALLIPDLRGEYQRAVDRADEGIGLARELGYPFLQLSGTVFRVWPASHLSDPAELLDVMDKALEKLRVLGSLYHYPHLLARRAGLLIRLGRVDEAQRTAAEALAQIEKSGEASIEADAWLAQGESWQAAGAAHWDPAQSCYLRALDVARRQGAKGWELRAAITLARLWQRQGQRQKSRDLIAPVYHWFTEGNDTANLREAAGLLREVC